MDAVIDEMDLKTYVKSLPVGERDDFALAVGTTPGHLRNIMYGCSLASPAIAVAIERLSGGQVSRRELRPDDALAIWPDLAHQVTAQHESTNTAAQLSSQAHEPCVGQCLIALKAQASPASGPAVLVGASESRAGSPSCPQGSH